MSDKRFRQSGFDKKLARLVEEVGETLAAAGKTQRFGPHSTNPTLPEDQRETNIDWLFREMDDLLEAIVELKQAARDENLV